MTKILLIITFVSSIAFANEAATVGYRDTATNYPDENPPCAEQEGVALIPDPAPNAVAAQEAGQQSEEGVR